jgi:hypothetical protein
LSDIINKRECKEFAESIRKGQMKYTVEKKNSIKSYGKYEKDKI